MYIYAYIYMCVYICMCIYISICLCVCVREIARGVWENYIFSLFFLKKLMKYD